MKKETQRRSISIRGDSYAKLKKYCDEQGITMSGWLEDQALRVILGVDKKGEIRGGGTHQM